jgi:enamine deaminase RidA (YjgF/YER057c/UK114 family)
MTRSRRYIKREATQTRAYSPAVVIEGGKTVYLTSQTAADDGAGKLITVFGLARPELLVEVQGIAVID